jgi:fatty acid desaturase
MSIAVENRAIMDLTGRRDRPGVARVAAHLALLAATGTSVVLALGTWWLLPAMVVHGIALSSCFAPLHEAVHRTVFTSRLANDILAAVMGAVIVLPAYWYRLFHMEHHRFTQIPGRDPELLIKKPETLAEYLIYVSGWHYWHRQLRNLLRNALGEVHGRFVPERQHPAVRREARLHVALYLVLAALVAAGWTWPLWLWALPILLGQPFLRLYLLAEHTGCPENDDIWVNTRTTISNPVVRWLMWNMPYHAEHHAFPAVPFHALPALHRRVGHRFAHVAPGYVAVHREILADLRS